jgi:hypothetical protein
VPITATVTPTVVPTLVSMSLPIVRSCSPTSRKITPSSRNVTSRQTASICSREVGDNRYGMR